MMSRPYADRAEGGRILAGALADYANRSDVLVLALPRGGVPVAYEVARALGAPLDVVLVRKLGVPGHEELAMGAVATGGALVRNDDVIRALNIADEVIEAAAQRERAELQRREQAYRDDRPPPSVQGRCVILVDDGLATGSTMLAAVAAMRQQEPRRIVIAVPVAPAETCATLRQHVDEVVCTATPAFFGGVGRWYRNFTQVSDEQVRALLEQAWSEGKSP